jgi:alkylation response protein AidB-like acyl-CoA dehydrogenase
MQFSFSEEQEEFRTILRRFLADKSPTSEVRKWMAEDEGFDREVWRQLSQDLGLPGVHIPEDYGGQGFGFVELALVCEEMGRALLPSPYFASTVLAATAILNAGTEDQKRELLPSIASGDTIATLAFTEENGRPDPGGVAMTAAAGGAGYVLNGSKSFVLDGHTADIIVVLARQADSRGEDDAELPTLAPLAKAMASDAYRHAAAESIQIHGGIGFTWEHDTQLYFKRAKGSEVMLGDPTWHRELLARRMGI